MNIISESKKNKLYFWIPFTFSLGAYYLFMQIVFFAEYGIWGVAIGTIWRYLIALLCPYISLDFFLFKLNGETFSFVPPSEIFIFLDHTETPPEVIETWMHLTNFHGIFHAVSLIERLLFFPIYSFLPWFIVLSISFSLIIWVRHMRSFTVIDGDKHIRGSSRISGKEFCSLSGMKSGGIIKIPTKYGKNLWLTQQQLLRHCLILGGTGTGKSNLMLWILPQLLKMNYGTVKAVILDAKGEFLSYFYRLGTDYIYNPYDLRSIGYNFFDDLSLVIQHHIDTETEPPMVRIISDVLADVASHSQHDSNKWVYEGASNLFFSAIMYCAMNRRATMKEFVLFCRQPLADMEKQIHTLPACFSAPADTIFTEAEETKANIYSTMKAQLTRFSATLETDGDFSIRQFMKVPGNLYLSRAGTMARNFDAIYKLILDMFCMQIRGAQQTKDIHFLLFIDEFGEIPVIDSLPTVLQDVRSRGGSVFLGNQTIAKIRAKYGPDEAENMLGNLNTRFYFRVNSAEEADYISKDIGEAEVERTNTSNNASAGGFKNGDRNGSSESQQATTRKAFLPAEVSGLKIGECIVDFKGLSTGTGYYPKAAIEIAEYHGTKKNSAFLDKYKAIEEHAEAEALNDEKQEAMPNSETVIQTPKPKQPESKTETKKDDVPEAGGCHQEHKVTIEEPQKEPKRRRTRHLM